jgi:hypothetical protein
LPRWHWTRAIAVEEKAKSTAKQIANLAWCRRDKAFFHPGTNPSWAMNDIVNLGGQRFLPFAAGN